MTEIADRLGRSRESVRLLVQGSRWPGGFPAPVSHLKARSRLWRWSEVAAWAQKIQTDAEVPRESLLIAAVNAALALRESALTLMPEERELVESLI